MRIFTSLLLTGLMLCSGFTYAQIAAWDFTGPDSPTTVAAGIYNANMDASNAITRGSGAPASTGANSFRTTGFQNNGIAVTNTDYFQITLSASTGYQLSLSTIDADVRGTASFAATPGASNQFAYSLNGTTFVLIGSPQLIVGATGSLAQIDLSGISALQNLPAATTVTLRYYASGQTATGGWGLYSAASGDYGLSVGGTVTSVSSCVPLLAPFAAPASTCSGSTATLHAAESQTGSILKWFTTATGGTSVQTGGTYTTGALTTQTSFWVQDSISGCPASPRTEVVVSINPLPNVNAGTDFTVCQGSNITLSGSGAVSYVWNNSVTNGVAFPINATTTYTVTGTDANNCVNTDNITVTVSGVAPTVNAGADQTICIGQSVALTATGTGTFTWDHGVSQAVPFSPTTTTTYTVTVDNGVCTNTDQVVVTVNQLSVAGTISASDLDACLGDVITGTITGNTGSVEWFVQASPFPYTSAGTTTTLSLTPPAAATYMVKAEVKNGVCAVATTNILTVVVNALPLVNAGADRSVCAGSPVTLIGTGASTYVWTNSVVNGTAFTPAATATYTVTGTDAHGCINTDAVVVTVNALPAVNAGTDQTICSGNSAILTGSPSSITNFSWNNGVTNGTPFSPTATGTYTVTGTDANGCANTDQVTVTVNALPDVTITVTNGSVFSVPNITGNTYLWVDCINNQPASGASTSASYSPTSATIPYKVQVTSATGCTASSECKTASFVGLEDMKADAGVTLYPNPSKGKVTLSMSNADRANVTVFNALGKIVTTINNLQTGTVIDLSSTPSGVYMIQVSTEKGSSIYRVVRN